jgi:phospholipid/cholesterol/gamma-HCH transport system substrate-binding protein
METNVNYTVAGAFIITLLAFIVFTIVWLSSGFNAKEYQYYTVYMKESISGLSKEGPVEFNGVNVGNVKDMKISHKNPQLVILTLEVEADTPVTIGTRAKLGMRALTGVAYILLEDKGKDMRPLTKQSGQNYPVIATEPSILVRLDTALTQINDSFRKVSTSIGSLLDKQNLQMMKGILKSGKGSLETIEVETLPETNEAISNFSEMSQDLSTFSGELKDNPSIIIRGKEPSTVLGPGEE